MNTKNLLISAMLCFVFIGLFFVEDAYGEDGIELFQEIDLENKKIEYNLTGYMEIENPLTLEVEPIDLGLSDVTINEEISNMLNKEKKEFLVNSIIDEGMLQLGKPYVFGAKGGESFDCSMLVKHSMESEGIKCPRTSREQRKMTRYIKYEELERGDFVFWHEGSINDYSNVKHVAIYLGNGKMLHATPPKVKVSNVVKDKNKGYNISYGRFDYSKEV